MGEVMAVLGITAADVQRDLDALSKASRLRAQVLTDGEEAELKRQAADVRAKACDEYRAHMKDCVDRLAEHQLPRMYEVLLIAAGSRDGVNIGTGREIAQRMVSAQLQLENGLNASRGAEKELDALKREHPLAFRGDE